MLLQLIMQRSYQADYHSNSHGRSPHGSAGYEGQTTDDKYNRVGSKGFPKAINFNNSKTCRVRQLLPVRTSFHCMLHADNIWLVAIIHDPLCRWYWRCLFVTSGWNEESVHAMHMPRFHPTGNNQSVDVCSSRQPWASRHVSQTVPKPPVPAWPYDDAWKRDRSQ